MPEKQTTQDTKTENRGGSRPNSGRKPRLPEEKCTHQLSLVVQKSLHDKIEELSKDYGKHKSTVAAILLQQYLSDEYIESSKNILKNFLKTLDKTKE